MLAGFTSSRPIGLPGIGAEPIAGRTTSIIALVSTLIEDAYRSEASDIHLDPTPAGLRVRMRIDGALTDRHLLPIAVHHETIARIKVLAGLRTDEHQVAQDGRFREMLLDDGGFADIRVSIAPTYHGENAVLRMLPDTAREQTLSALGFDAGHRAIIESALKKPDGMLLATGPTGSGKTTTLYALLRLLHRPEAALVTIEDPIEYAIDGVKQIPVLARTGLTFAKGLRAILRQDPDIVMVGEIRDGETAGIAVNTALTGHLLLSTLHTNDAATAIPRLTDLGVEPFLIASTLRLVIAQRLVRRICDACREPADIPQEVADRFSAFMPAEADWCIGAGCDACSGSGYRGRISVSEILSVDEAVRDAIVKRSSARDIASLAKEQGMRALAEDGLSKAARGETSIEEVLRVIHD